MKKADPKSASHAAQGELEAVRKEVDALRERLRAVESERDRFQKEAQEARDRQLRARADYDNLVKRTSKESQETVRFVKGGLLLRVAALVESLEQVAHDLKPRLGPDARGVELVLAEARRLLLDESLVEIPTKGHPFDVRLHQAVERVETSDQAESTILDVVLRGYKLGDEVLRPALVRVAVAPRHDAPAKPAAAKE